MSEPRTADLDRVGLDILRELAAERLGATSVEREHEPCAMCGLASSPRGRGPHRRRALGLICGRCSEWTHDSSADPRDIAAAVLTGISTHTRRTNRTGLGERVGVVYYCETEHTGGNRTPWAHLDIAAMRDRVQQLAAQNYLRLPNNYDPRACVTW